MIIERERPRATNRGFHIVPAWLASEKPGLRRAQFLQPKEGEEMTAHRRERSEPLDQVVNVPSPPSTGSSAGAEVFVLGGRDSQMLDRDDLRTSSQAGFRRVAERQTFNQGQPARLGSGRSSLSSRRSDGRATLLRASPFPVERDHSDHPPVVEDVVVSADVAHQKELIQEEAESEFDRNQREIQQIMRDLHEKKAKIERLEEEERARRKQHEKQREIERLSEQLRKQNETIQRIQEQLAHSAVRQEAELPPMQQHRHPAPDGIQSSEYAPHLLPAESIWVPAPQQALAHPAAPQARVRPQAPPSWAQPDMNHGLKSAAVPVPQTLPSEPAPLWIVYDDAKASLGVGCDELPSAEHERRWAHVQAFTPQPPPHVHSFAPAPQLHARTAAPQPQLPAHSLAPPLREREDGGRRRQQLERFMRGGSDSRLLSEAARASEFDRLLRPESAEPRRSRDALGAEEAVGARGGYVTRQVQPVQHELPADSAAKRPPGRDVDADPNPLGRMGSAILSTRPGWWQDEARKHAAQTKTAGTAPRTEAAEHWWDALAESTAPMWKEFEAHWQQTASAQPRARLATIAKRVRFVDPSPPRQHEEAPPTPAAAAAPTSTSTSTAAAMTTASGSKFGYGPAGSVSAGIRKLFFDRAGRE